MATSASREGSVDDGDDGAEVLAGGELGDDAAVGGVDGDLRGDDVGELACAALDDGGGGLVAGALDAQDQCTIPLVAADARIQCAGRCSPSSILEE